MAHRLRMRAGNAIAKAEHESVYLNRDAHKMATMMRFTSHTYDVHYHDTHVHLQLRRTPEQYHKLVIHASNNSLEPFLQTFQPKRMITTTEIKNFDEGFIKVLKQVTPETRRRLADKSFVDQLQSKLRDAQTAHTAVMQQALADLYAIAEREQVDMSVIEQLHSNSVAATQAYINLVTIETFLA